MSRLAVYTSLAVVIMGSLPVLGASYSVTAIPSLDSDANYPTTPININNNGVVTGWSTILVNYIIFQYHLPHAIAFRGSTTTDLGTISGSGTFGMSGGRGINDSNYIVGINASADDDTKNHAFLWQGSGSLIDLGSMTGSSTDLSGAYAINSGGHIAGSWASSGDPNVQHAFLRWSSGVVTSLGTLGGSASFCWDLNDSNQIVGKADMPGSPAPVRAFFWQNGVMSNLGVLPGYDASSEAIGINNSGQIIGISTSSGGTGHSFLYQNGTMTDLGVLSGRPTTTAMFINDWGIIVGAAFDTSGQSVAVAYKDGQLVNLNTVAGSSGYTLNTATSINTQGQIVGTATYNSTGKPRGYLMQVYTLATKVSPIGGGTVSTSPSAVFYDPNATVSVTATAATGYTFSNWSGDASGSTNPVSVKLTKSKGVTANFTPVRYTLTLTSNPTGAGTISASPAPGGDGKYDNGTVVTLTANANSGYVFSNWSGGASGSTNPTTVTISGDTSVTANFNTTGCSLSLAASPADTGYFNTDPAPGGDGKYTYGTVVTITAIPNTGYSFSSWSGDASGSTNPTTVTMNGNKSVTGNFAQARYTLTLTPSPSGGGTIGASPAPDGDGKYAYGTVVTLTASPAAGYSFTSWSGDASGSTNPTTVTMNANKSVTATFTELRYSLTLTASPTAGGTIGASPAPGGDGKYAYGTVVTLTANPAAGYSFTSWSGDASGSTNPTTVTMNANKSVTATFGELRYTLTLTANPTAGGTIGASPAPGGDGKYAYGTVVTLTASQAAGYSFTSWSGDASGSANPTTVTMNANKSVTANFGELRYSLTLTASPTEGGTIGASPAPGGDGKYAYGTVVTLTANPAAGYSFTGWSGDASGTTNPTTVTMDGNKSVTAGFSQLSHTLTLNVDPSGTGSISANPAPGGDGKYAYGTVVTLTATATGGYSFSTWSGDASGSTNPVQITMTGDKTVTANFSQLRHQLTIAVAPAGTGSVQASPAPDIDGKYAYGTVVTLTASANLGYVFGSWSGGASGSTNPTTVTMDANKSVTANFAVACTLILTVLHPEWGTILVEPNLPAYPAGSLVTLTATPISGKSFDGWTLYDPAHPGDGNYIVVIDPNTLANPLVLPLTINASTEVEAKFKCGSGVNQMLPMLAFMLGTGVLITRVSRRRK